MEERDVLNLYDVPLRALRAQTRQIISSGLQKQKVLLSEEKLPRYWKGLALLAQIPEPTGENATDKILVAWEAQPTASLGQLEEFLGKLDRWDVLDDIYSLIREDAKEYLKRTARNSAICAVEDLVIDRRALTFGDIKRIQDGIELEMYDALLLYADEDKEFGQKMLDELTLAGFKICSRDSLLAGISFEHQGIMELITERCRHVIIIVSQYLIHSKANRFFVLYAQALAIEKEKRIIIPCIYGKEYVDKIPMEINHMAKLNYNRSHLPQYDFWGRLKDSITNTSRIPYPPLTQNALSLHEMSSLHIEAMESLSPLNSVRSVQNTTDLNKRSRSELSLSTNSSDESRAPPIKEKKTKSKSRSIIKRIFRSNKHPKEQAIVN